MLKKYAPNTPLSGFALTGYSMKPWDIGIGI